MHYLITAILFIVAWLLGAYLIALIAVAFYGTEAGYLFLLIGSFLSITPAVIVSKRYLKKKL